MKILVTGANGFVGSNLVQKLLESQHDVSVLVRNHWNGEGEVNVITGDLLKPQSLQSINESYDVAYYLVHGLSEKQEDFEFLESSCAVNFLHWIGDRCKKIIYLGGIAPHDDVLSPHLRSRKLTGEILGVGKIPVLEFRASIILGKGSVSYEMIKAISERFPFRPKWRILNQICQPLSLADLLAYLEEAMLLDIKDHKIIEIAGPNAISYGELLDLFSKTAGLDRIQLPVPDLDNKTIGIILNHAIPELSEVGSKLAASLDHSTEQTDFTAEKLFPTIKPQEIQEVLRKLEDEIDYRYTMIWDKEFLKEVLGDKISFLKGLYGK